MRVLKGKNIELSLSGKRWCPSCKSPVDTTNFRIRKTGNYRPACKPCEKKRQDAYTKLNPEKVKKTRRNAELKRDFGVDLVWYDEQFRKQNGVCAVCFQPETGKRLAVDHCHKTKIVRGLLCSRCNRGIGHFKDRVDLLQSAIKYLCRI